MKKNLYVTCGSIHNPTFLILDTTKRDSDTSQNYCCKIFAVLLFDLKI